MQTKSNPTAEGPSEVDREEVKPVHNPAVGKFARSEVNRQAELEKENQRLKELVAELSLSIRDLQKAEQKE